MVAGAQNLVDQAGERAAGIVPLDDWECIQEALEELAELRAYDEAKHHPSDPGPCEQVMAQNDVADVWHRRAVDRR